MDYNDHDYKTNNFNHNQYDKETKFIKENDDVVSLGTWIILLIILAIPIVNILALLILVFGQDNINLKNFAKATLIIMIIGFFFSFMLGGCTY